MRISDNQNYDAVRNAIARSKSRMEDLQFKHSTLKKLNTPSDDPVGAAKVLEVRSDKVTNDQFQMNAKMAETYLENSDHALGELGEILIRAKEIAVSQSSGASSNAETRLGVAEEVTQLYNQAVAAANRRIGDRYLFGGYKTQRPPVDGEGRYQGDDGQMMVEISKDVFLSMNVPGIDAFNTNPKGSFDSNQVYGREREPAPELSGPARGPASALSLQATPPEGPQPENVNVFDELQNLRIALLTSDQEGIRGTLERIDQIHAKVISTRSKIGSRLQGLQSTVQANERHNITNAQLTQNLEDADMAQVVSDLAKEETVFRSALASSQKLLQPTLLQFLK
jgi:flagellar hook-associated protein 3 FlgL